MRFETYRQNPLEWSESPRVVPAPPGRRAAADYMLFEVDAWGMISATGVSFTQLTSLPYIPLLLGQKQHGKLTGRHHA